MTRLLAIVGPTAAGKSSLAMELAPELDAEIISVDSMQVYQGMDIGTAKPSAGDRRLVTHHMIDLCPPSEEFSVAEFSARARQAIARSSASTMLIVGGSGLHFRSVVDPMTFRPTDASVRAEIEASPPEERVRELLEADPDAGRHLDLANPRRVIRSLEAFRLTGVTPSERADDPQRRRFRDYDPEIPFAAVGIDRSDLSTRVASRLDKMMRDGLLEEVESVAPLLGRTASQAVGYKQLLSVVRGSLAVEEGVDNARRATMRLAKQQRTYFRRDPRITWLDGSESHLAAKARKLLRA